MYISPPLTILAFLAVVVASMAWLAPPQRHMTQITVMLPTATYQKLVLRGMMYARADERPLTAVQVIEELTKNWQRDNEAPTN